MSETVVRPAPDERADRLRTKRAVARAFAAQPSPRLISAALAAALGVRLVLAGTSWGWADVVVLAVTVVLVGPVEWVIHRYLLHAPPDSWTSRTLGTGSGHRQHHLDPPALEWILLRGVDAAVFVPLIVLVTLAWSVPTLTAFDALVPGQGVGAAALTAVVAALGALWHYEWTHLLIHTGYRPRTRYYRRRARDHRRHHHRNERYWLGITSRTGDLLAGTGPRDPSSVPLSETARTLA